jgi:hypothetical protein
MRASWGLLVTVLVAGVVLAGAGSAGAATITACVNKKTGEMRIRTGKAARKKCPKGTRKLRWNTRGPAGRPGASGTNGTNGTNGPPGPVINLHDASGAVVGQLLTVFSEGGLHYLLLRDGEVWDYLGSGQLNPYTGGPDFTTADCTGTAYLTVPNAYTKQTWLALIAGSYRVTYRTANSGVFGAPRAWKSSGTTQPVTATQLYRRDNTGTCETDGGPFTGDLVVMDEVAAPPDFAGPLTIG